MRHSGFAVVCANLRECQGVKTFFAAVTKMLKILVCECYWMHMNHTLIMLVLSESNLEGEWAV